jgi:2-alkyl-3-oxoalkanoate reductase
LIPNPDAGHVLVTGATGFLGRYVVAAALRGGHAVRAVVRPGRDEADLPWDDHPALQTVRLDLRRPDSASEALEGCTTVVHLAATKTGDFASRFAGTVVATENLLDAMDAAGVRRLVHCSTFSVYRAEAVPPNGVLDETVPVENRPLLRDEYAQVKLVQEQLVRDWAAASGREHVILRPGLIYGPEELWHSLVGVEILPSLWLGAGWRTRMPMAWVENVADAFECALKQVPLANTTVNVVDDFSPSISEYVRAVRPLMEQVPRRIVLGYPASRLLVRAVQAVNRQLLDSRLKLPGGLSPVPFEARFRPLRYPNRRAKDVLGWTPRIEFPDTVGQARAASLAQSLRTA